MTVLGFHPSEEHDHHCDQHPSEDHNEHHQHREEHCCDHHNSSNNFQNSNCSFNFTKKLTVPISPKLRTAHHHDSMYK